MLLRLLHYYLCLPGNILRMSAVMKRWKKEKTIKQYSISARSHKKYMNIILICWNTHTKIELGTFILQEKAFQLHFLFGEKLQKDHRGKRKCWFSRNYGTVIHWLQKGKEVFHYSHKVISLFQGRSFSLLTDVTLKIWITG